MANKRKKNLKKIPTTMYLVGAVALIIGFVLGQFYNRPLVTKNVDSSHSKLIQSNQVVRDLVEAYNAKIKEHNKLVDSWNDIAPKWWAVRNDGVTGSAYIQTHASCIRVTQEPLESVIRYAVVETCPE